MIRRTLLWLHARRVNRQLDQQCNDLLRYANAGVRVGEPEHNPEKSWWFIGAIALAGLCIFVDVALGIDQFRLRVEAAWTAFNDPQAEMVEIVLDADAVSALCVDPVAPVALPQRKAAGAM